MARIGIVNPQSEPRPLVVLTAASLVGALLLAALLAMHGVNQNLDSVTLPVAGRTLNQFMAVVLTCIALIVPLTANLYTPRLVTLYVRHPLIVTMLSLLLVSHIICLGLNFTPPRSLLNHVLVDLLTLIYLLVMMGALPFLYGISRFLRPSYFVPMLTKKGVMALRCLSRGRHLELKGKELFETIDVVTNIALTGMHRGDRQLVLLALSSLHVLLTEIIGSNTTHDRAWRHARSYFVPGLAREGQDYLVRERIWPEAYVLTQTLRVMEMANKNQHELMAELAGHLVETAQLASVIQQDEVAELHVMAFNSLMRQAVEEKDLRRFQNLSYYYRLLIEAFHETPDRMHDATQHLLHYGKLAAKQGLHFGLETVVYDLGELVLSLARHDEPRAVELVQVWAGPLWQDAIAQGSAMQKVGWRTLIRLYWEAKAAGLEQLTEVVYWRYLSDETIHREHVEMVLDENRELHFEFNDRLMRFAHLSPAAEELARAFSEEY
jgi:hypothetical protein